MFIGVTYIYMPVVNNINLIRYAFKYKQHVSTKLRMLSIVLSKKIFSKL